MTKDIIEVIKQCGEQSSGYCEDKTLLIHRFKSTLLESSKISFQLLIIEEFEYFYRRQYCFTNYIFTIKEV